MGIQRELCKGRFDKEQAWDLKTSLTHWGVAKVLGTCTIELPISHIHTHPSMIRFSVHFLLNWIAKNALASHSTNLLLHSVGLKSEAV